MIKHLERLLQWSCGLLSALALFCIMWLTLVDVSGRKFLNNSVPGSVEVTEVLMVIVIFGALPLVSMRGEHVIFDSLDPFVPKALKGLQQRLVNLVCAGTFALLAQLLVRRAHRFAEYGEVTSRLLIPLSPVAWMMATMLGITALLHLYFVFAGQAQAGHGPHPSEAQS